MPAPVDSLIVLAVGLLVGGFGIYVGARIGLKSPAYGHAVVTAALGALAWGIVDYLFGALGAQASALSSIVGLLVWIWVIRRRYGVGWLRGAAIGLGAWIATLGALAILAFAGIGGLDAYGVPGT